MEAMLRARPGQFAVLVEYMERYGDLARPQPGAQGRARSDKLWAELTTMINAVGGGVNKPADKWKKFRFGQTGNVKPKKRSCHKASCQWYWWRSKQNANIDTSRREDFKYTGIVCSIGEIGFNTAPPVPEGSIVELAIYLGLRPFERISNLFAAVEEQRSEIQKEENQRCAEMQKAIIDVARNCKTLINTFSQIGYEILNILRNQSTSN